VSANRMKSTGIPNR